MTAIAEKIHKEALQLSQEERAALAHSLILSLEAEADPDAEAAWDAELELRLKQIEADQVKERPVEDVMAEIKGRRRS